ncbi:NHLP leader peptide family RiPP precursor [Argonema galeatum]|uniref:NHLP leader peptide family RiPP precursor n=1 Tax=Argonema galeatum TaxID=2942762 RepID=UPI0020128926|nr:NHLP leader peptide family RiPP precursor [Argonema galeatum]MCL1467185.1 NHLP leader peptide family RiPP precursor [Argonema galeatum A003/A1]
MTAQDNPQPENSQENSLIGRNFWAKIIAKAWADEEFKQRLLENPTRVLEEEGIAIPEGLEIQIEPTDNSLEFIIPPEIEVETRPGAEAVRLILPLPEKAPEVTETNIYEVYKQPDPPEVVVQKIRELVTRVPVDTEQAQEVLKQIKEIASGQSCTIEEALAKIKGLFELEAVSPEEIINTSIGLAARAVTTNGTTCNPTKGD